jgi:hypothetical protein
MKIRILTAAVLTAFVLSITFNVYAQNDTKKVDKKEQITDQKAPKTEKKPGMKKVSSKEKFIQADKNVEKKDVKTPEKDGKKVKTTKVSKKIKTEEKAPEKN